MQKQMIKNICDDFHEGTQQVVEQANELSERGWELAKCLTIDKQDGFYVITIEMEKK